MNNIRYVIEWFECIYDEYYKEEIETKLAYQETLKETKSNINSEEYIEEVAREKLDMYLPNEKVYIDKNK